MKKNQQLKICNWSLAAFAIVMLASGIQLEITGWEAAAWVWVHIAMGAAMAGVAVWHLWLHYRARWGQLFSRQSRPKVKFMTVFLILTTVTGLIATAQWLPTGVPTHIGGIHGKLGFIFLFLTITHGLHYKQYYLK